MPERRWPSIWKRPASGPDSPPSASHFRPSIFAIAKKKRRKKKIPQKETTKEREMCGDSNRFPFLHREEGGTCRGGNVEKSARVKKKRDGIVLQSKRGAKKITISKKEEEDRLRVTRKHTGTQEEEDTEHAGTPSLLCLKKK